MLSWIGKELEMVLANPIIVGELCEGGYIIRVVYKWSARRNDR